MYEVSVVIRGVGSAGEDQLAALQSRLEAFLGVQDPAVIFWPQDEELGLCFQLEEEVLGQLLEPEAGCIAA